jgi:hypothetical protein
MKAKKTFGLFFMGENMKPIITKNFVNLNKNGRKNLISIKT